MTGDDQILKLLAQAKELAQRYRQLTKKPLGITGEVAEYEAARILGLTLADARQPGYDAIEEKDGVHRRLQIKGRCLLNDSKRSQRLGSIKVESEWDAVLLVLLDENLDAFEIFEANRCAVERALFAPPYSKARHDRRALSLSKFKAIGTPRWQRSASAVVSDSGSPLVASTADRSSRDDCQRRGIPCIYQLHSS